MKNNRVARMENDRCKKNESLRKKMPAQGHLPDPLGILVGCEGFEPTTPALSRRCSKPTELTSRGTAKL